MAYKAEGRIVRELGKFLLNGGLFRGEKPVMWSPVEKTALAEAEVEYHDHKSTQIWVRFPVINTEIEALKNGYAVIWTTTPWTIPGNRAIAYGADLEYAVVEIVDPGENEVLKSGDTLLLADLSCHGCFRRLVALKTQKQSLILGALICKARFVTIRFMAKGTTLMCRSCRVIM